MKISVALAAYKGEKYIARQLSSILSQLHEDDEVIVSDDFPQGETKKAVEQMCDSRIKYIEGPAQGVCANFENALRHCKGDIIFLADQDDVWLDNKVETVCKALEENDLVMHNAYITDSLLNKSGETCFSAHNANTGFLSNLIRNSFTGCCMAFRKEILAQVLPLPKGVPMHDWWIGLVVLKKGYKVSLVDEPLMLWRRHEDSVTGKKTSLLQKIKFRLKMIGFLFPVCQGKE